MTTRVIHTAQALVDEIVEIDRIPQRGGNAMASTLRRYAGGAVTILLAAARSGGQGVLAGSVGRGPNGDLIRSVLGEEGIELSSPLIDDLDTGTCFVMIEPDGERTFVTSRGAERQISVESLQTSDPQPGDLICISGYSLLDPTREPLEAWLAGLPVGVDVVLDPGAVFAQLPKDVRDRTLAAITIWSSNLQEAQELSGESDWSRAAFAVSNVLRPGAVVIVRDGEKGCVVLADGQLHVVEGYPQRAVDTNGAGDTHTGILLAERANGLDWAQAAKRANAGAAIKVTRHGPTTAPTSAEIDAFLSNRLHVG